MRLEGCLLVAVFSVTAAAAEVAVEVRAAAGSRCGADGVVVATPADPQIPVVRAVLKEARSTLPLDAAHDWRISIEADGCWSEAVQWTGQDASHLVLHGFAAGEIAGSLLGEAPQADVLTATLFPAADGTNANRLPAAGHPLSCTLEYPHWRCRAPADIPFDLRLELPGVAAMYFWTVTVPPGTVRTLESQRLQPGASVSGWIHDPKGNALKDAGVVIAPVESDAGEASTPVALRRKTRTNHRGFFQFAGLPAGDYQIVSHVTRFSPAIVPLVTLRDGERLEWPRPIAHLPLARLDLTLEPPIDAAGKPWIVELIEHTRVPAAAPARPIKRAASPDGRLAADSLRADLYRLNVWSSSDSVMERTWVDLSNGGLVPVTVRVSTLRAEGVVTVGDQPLEAEVRFSNHTGKAIRAKTDENGRFETAFPAAGPWDVTVHYAIDDFRAQVDGTPVDIPEHADGPVRLEIALPGGRIRGKVTMPDGTPVKAAIHVRSSKGMLVAQQVTSNRGAFEFVGLDEAGYVLDAEGERGATARPLHVQATEGRANELHVVLEPYRELRAEIHTPSGAAATGAVVELSLDGGRSWLRQAVGPNGLFRYSVPAGVDVVQLIALTYGYPSALVRIPMEGRVREPIVIRLQRAGGLLRVKGRTPYVLRDDMVVPFNAFFFPEPFGRFDGAIHLEPGSYAVCPQPQRDAACRDVVITPYGESFVELERVPEDTDAP